MNTTTKTIVKQHGQVIAPLHSNRRGVVHRAGYGVTDSYGNQYTRDANGTIRRTNRVIGG